MNANSEWNIQSRAPACQACGERFIDRQPCHTLLRFVDAGYQRTDLCEKCFPNHTTADGIHSSWKGIYQAPPPPSQKTARKEDVETLLRRLVEEKDPANIQIIFVLSVMLERKRILVERAVHTEPDGSRQYVYEHRKSGDTFIVADPELQLDRIDGLEEQVAYQLAQTARKEGQAEP